VERPGRDIRPFQQRRTVPWLTNVCWWTIDGREQINRSRPSLSQLWPVGRFDHGPVGLVAALVSCRSRAQVGSGQNGPHAGLALLMERTSAGPDGRLGVSGSRRIHHSQTSADSKFWRSPRDVKVRSETIRCSPRRRRGTITPLF